jgi:hypothetical protein
LAAAQLDRLQILRLVASVGLTSSRDSPLVLLIADLFHPVDGFRGDDAGRAKRFFRG